MPNTIVCIGDSLTLGLQVEITMTVRMAMKYPGINVVNLGVGSNTTTQMLARISTVDAYNPFRVIIWGGVNDVGAGTSSATIQANLQAMYDYCKVTKGYEVFAVTITPADTNTAPNNVVRTTVNDWIKAVPSGVDRVIDAWTAVRDPADSTIRLAEYAVPLPDIVHLNDVGQAVVMSLFPSL